MKYVFLVLIWMVTIEANSIKDNKTGLMWQDNSDAKSIKKNWQDSKRYCNKLTLDGYRDWRLPSIQELQSIVDVKRYNPAIKTIFKNTSSGVYWSSTEVISDSKSAWIVFFKYGTSQHDFYKGSNHCLIRCVR